MLALAKVKLTLYLAQPPPFRERSMMIVIHEMGYAEQIWGFVDMYAIISKNASRSEQVGVSWSRPVPPCGRAWVET